MILPFLTMTQPTRGLGEVMNMPFSAHCSASCMPCCLLEIFLVLQKMEKRFGCARAHMRTIRPSDLTVRERPRGRPLFYASCLYFSKSRQQPDCRDADARRN